MSIQPAPGSVDVHTLPAPILHTIRESIFVLRVVPHCSQYISGQLGYSPADTGSMNLDIAQGAHLYNEPLIPLPTNDFSALLGSYTSLLDIDLSNDNFGLHTPASL